MKLNKKWLVLCGLLAIGAGGYHYLQRPEPISPYATEVVRKGNIEKAVLANGMLQASKLVNVGAQVSGQIQRLAVNLGDEIKQGDLIAQIDSLTQQNSLKEAQASLNSLNAQYQAKQAQIKQANYEYVRQKGMLAAKASSRADYENAEATLAIYKAELAQLDAEIEKAKINVDNAQLDLGYTTINAPMDGDDSDLSISDSDAIYYNAVFDVKNPQGILRIGMTAQVSIVLEQSENTLIVPSQVLQKSGGKGNYTVPVLEQGQVVQKPVTVGINNKVNAEILSGLKEGDQVVLGNAMDGESSSRGDRRRPPMRF
ncbi:efflux transporter periplasmic adaptor subunit [Vibrio parahaemolyticus]|uniref:biotin/lipoyl-binding protein n=1 Tax=Vibrio parahaemolyticus TaxID=670 RepID=UPI00084A49E3|nr:biotin/lipoyl-binding protein [Vibrio parahaemolyticus]EGR0747607.1 biotin/lipoyl-binding protein [Vibrio parahaemolyticus]EGR1181096.1 biotin/lipoyl-binding protein [Vibrio parahaemolyticus]EHO8536162.1 biotin/lipoyl-binding protein [Vibrio parahaemolyticus]EIF2843262.1 biotin/lipoyl-binding protein [Vibrio parahaemolyticus]EIJ2230301.1 biotin/lipoyl-binding protein [Vibrio parahaemolyticus]